MHMYDLNIIHRYKEAYITLAFLKSFFLVELHKLLLNHSNLISFYS